MSPLSSNPQPNGTDSPAIARRRLKALGELCEGNKAVSLTACLRVLDIQIDETTGWDELRPLLRARVDELQRIADAD
jgi:hypothetical protein